MDEKEKREPVKPTSVRLSDAVQEKFRKLCSELDLNQDNTLNTLISAYEMQVMRDYLPARAVEIESFQMHLESLSAAFKVSLQLNQEAEERVKLNFNQQLISNQKTIESLQAEVEKQKESSKYYQDVSRQSSEKAQSTGEELKRLKGELEKAEELLREYKEKSATLSQMLTEYSEDRNQIKDLEKALKQAETELSQLQSEKRELEIISKESQQDKDNEITQLKAQIEVEKKQAEAERKIAILTQKNEFQEKIATIKDEKNNEINSLLKELDSLRNQILLSNQQGITKNEPNKPDDETP